MSKVRVYMVAKELGMDNKSLVALLHSLGVTEVRNHMSAVGPEQVERVKRHLSKQSSDKAPEERVRSRGGSGAVIIRRGKRKSAEAKSTAKPSASPGGVVVRKSASKPVEAPKVEVRRAESKPAQKVQAAPPVAEPKPVVPSAPAAPTSAPAPQQPPVAAKPSVAESVPAQPKPTAEPAAKAQQTQTSAPPTKAEAPKAEASQAQVSEPATKAQAGAGAVQPKAAQESSAPAVESVQTQEASKAANVAESGAAKPSATEQARTSTSTQTAGASQAVKETPAAAAASAPQVPKAQPQAKPAASKPERAAQTPAVQRRPTAGPKPQGPAAARAAAAAAARANGEPIPNSPPPQKSSTQPSKPAPKTGIDVWQGRPGVPMPQQPRGGIAPRRVQYDAKMGGGGQRRGPMMGGRRGPGPRRGIGSMRNRQGGGASVTQERSAHKKVVKIEGSIALQALAGKLGIKAGELLMKLMSLGVTGININSTLDSDTAKIVGEEFGWTVSDVAVSEDEAIAAAQGGVEDDDENREPRAPVVSVMGHVDHGKTSLLDRIRKTTVASGEAGGITQHIGAYSVKTPKGRIAFLDTPGHAAFTAMRARGARCTDIVVLVVAADDGVMPQTKEALNHAKAAGCPIVVAVNKIDKADAQPERVRRELSELGLQPEEWGGDTIFCEVSAATGEGIDTLLDAIVLQGEMLELRANPKRPATGTVIEAKLDRGQGPVATVLVMDGTLRKGEGLLVGSSWGKVRAMLDENGKPVNKAGPATPVAVIGLSEVPSAGDAMNSVPDPKKAQQIAESRRTKERSKMSATAKISMEELALRMSQSDQKELKLIIKGDVQGSVEALIAALNDLSTDKVRVNVVHSGVGAVTEGDINLAVAAEALVIGFNVRPAGKARALAQKEGVESRHYTVIYDVIDDVRATMEGLLTPKLVEEAIGAAEVRKIFKVSKAGVVAGCMVTNGVVRRNALVRLQRDGDVIWEGKLDSLKRFKDDAKEVREGFDCGISFQGYSDLQEGDMIAAFEMKEVRPTL